MDIGCVKPECSSNNDESKQGFAVPDFCRSVIENGCWKKIYERMYHSLYNYVIRYIHHLRCRLARLSGMASGRVREPFWNVSVQRCCWLVQGRRQIQRHIHLSAGNTSTRAVPIVAASNVSFVAWSAVNIRISIRSEWELTVTITYPSGQVDHPAMWLYVHMWLRES